MWAGDLIKAIEHSNSVRELDEITTNLLANNVQYNYPIQLKELLTKYATLVQIVVKK
jgi:hypothetical protein